MVAQLNCTDTVHISVTQNACAKKSKVTTQEVKQ